MTAPVRVDHGGLRSDLDAFACPRCGDIGSPLKRIGDLGVTSCCGAFVAWVPAEGWSLATGAHADQLSTDDLKELRQHRGTKRSAQEQASLAAVKAKLDGGA